MNRDSQEHYEYKFTVILISLTLIILIPLFFLGPFLFNNILFSSLPSLGKIVAFSSVVIGLWFIFSALHIINTKDKNISTDFLASGAGSEFTLLVIPFVVYKGTKSFLNQFFTKKSKK